ncbi:hypothetical protein [Actibacterium sp. 188UL27-1]|uniref:hypothetical protein n=1 Tax=Actibacterium sp. 188UL27-1 TaxID=2786961 RepID=UPI00195CF575|nr:hypothetical protein [Actibacterium sp. 188UL27-1]MBM7068231.1 hypothetical protein [Actibacterium sp. 188UL27-1]
MTAIRTSTLALAVLTATSGQSNAETHKPGDVQTSVSAPNTSRHPEERPRNRPVTQPFARGKAQPKAPRGYEQAQIASNMPESEPLTADEIAAFRTSIQRCWNIGGLSKEAQGISLNIGLTLDRDAKPDPASVTLISASEGSQEAVAQAFNAARRAIIRCGLRGFDLPKDKYAQWRDIEMVFNPERMRIK